jgi:hypothetical protein
MVVEMRVSFFDCVNDRSMCVVDIVAVMGTHVWSMGCVAIVPFAAWLAF